MVTDHNGHKRSQIDFLPLQCCVSIYIIKTKDSFLPCEASALFQQVVLCPVMRHVTHSMYLVGIWRWRMLCMMCAMTALGNAPEMSRKRPDMTRPFLHFLKVQWMASISGGGP
jgi:hypothetical protein